MRTPEGEPIPPNTLAELHLDMERRRLVIDQIRQIENARLQRLAQAPSDAPHGEHTFFVDEIGLNIVVPIDGEDDEQEQAGEVVRVAAWQDARQTALASHDPEATGVVVEPGSKNRGSIH